jgi:hypothetical protein
MYAAPTQPCQGDMDRSGSYNTGVTSRDSARVETKLNVHVGSSLRTFSDADNCILLTSFTSDLTDGTQMDSALICVTIDIISSLNPRRLGIACPECNPPGGTRLACRFMPRCAGPF